MTPNDPQFTYMVLILPSLFGFTLVGEGINRLMRAQMVGWVSIGMGIAFIGTVVVAYFVLTGRV